MDNSVEQFVEKIKTRLSRIEANLSNEERLKYQSQIDMIYRLLDLFEDTGGVSKEIKKIQFTKVSSKTVEAFPWFQFENKIKFHGASVVHCNPVGELKSRTLG